MGLGAEGQGACRVCRGRQGTASGRVPWFKDCAQTHSCSRLRRGDQDGAARLQPTSLNPRMGRPVHRARLSCHASLRNVCACIAVRFAREIAELKTRLAEKDAQLMGGFGDLEALRRGELPPPDLSMPLWGNGGGGGGGPDGQSNGNRHGVSTPPGMIMPNHQPPVPLRPTGSPGTGAGRGGAGRAGSAGEWGDSLLLVLPKPCMPANRPLGMVVRDHRSRLVLRHFARALSALWSIYR